MNLSQFEAINEISLLKARYCRFVDQKRWTDLSTLMHPDIGLTFFGVLGEVVHKFHDRQTFIEQCPTVLDMAQTIHQVHNPEIHLISKIKAEAIWSMEDWIIYPDNISTTFKTLHGFGHYYESVEKIDGQWVIRTLELRRTILEIK